MMETTNKEFNGTIDTWFVKEYEGNKTLAEVTTEHCGPICKIERFDHPENKANAKLIAAAPELLYALEELKGAINIYAHMYGIGKLTHRILEANEQAESAISSALGE